MGNSTLRHVLAALLALTPVAFALVYGVVRDVPPSSNCGDGETEQSLIDAYRAGAAWFIAIGEIVALAVLGVALRALGDAAGPRVGLAAAAVPAALGVAVGSGLLASDWNEEAGVSFLVALAVAAAAGWVLGRIVKRTSVGPPPAAAVGLAVAMVPVGWFLLLFAVFIPGAVALPVAIASVMLAVWLVRPPGDDGTEAWRALAYAAAFVAVLVIPTEAAVILSRGHGPLSC